MKKKFQVITLQPAGTSVLKATAILAVLMIHVLSSIKPSPFINGSPFQIIAVSLDQLARISVPLFVAVSGYGLALSYSVKKFKFAGFFTRRILKILPLYLLWSCIYGLTFHFIFNWAPATDQPNFLWQLLLGRADYHLYFVPMTFQLYLFFPVILYFFKKWPLATLIVALLTQLIWWWFFSYQGLTVTSWKYFAGDGEQYLWMTNWIAYFVLGMYLPKIWQWFENYKIVFLVIFFLWLGSTVFTILDALHAINNGIDPLFALKFTRYPLFAYSSLAIIVISYLVAKIKNFNSAFIKLGENSYQIYLSHTLFLRIISSLFLFL